MSVTKGIKAIKEMQRQRAERQAEMDQKLVWFKVKKNETRNIAFLQELDEESELYDPTKGLAIFVVEHSPEGPEGWKYRATCTMEDQGRCWACEKAVEDPTTGLRSKTNMYVNVVDEDGEVKVFSRSAYSGVVDTLTAHYEEEENITGNGWRVSKGTDNRAGWTALPSKRRPELKSGAELFDLEKAIVKKLDYAEQRAYFEPGIATKEDDSTETSAVSSAKDNSDSVEW